MALFHVPTTQRAGGKPINVVFEPDDISTLDELHIGLETRDFLAGTEYWRPRDYHQTQERRRTRIVLATSCVMSVRDHVTTAQGEGGAMSETNQTVCAIQQRMDAAITAVIGDHSEPLLAAIRAEGADDDQVDGRLVGRVATVLMMCLWHFTEAIVKPGTSAGEVSVAVAIAATHSITAVAEAKIMSEPEGAVH